MNIYTASNARQNLFQIIKQVCESHIPTYITSKSKDVVMIDKEDYESMQETLHLLSIPNMRESIRKGMDTPLEKCDDKLDW